MGQNERGGQGYEDIIELPHHVSETRGRMSARDRAAQFSPFAALTGFGGVITEAARDTHARIELDEHRKAELNDRLNELLDGAGEPPELSLTYFVPDARKSGGEYITRSGRVKKLDRYNRLIVLSDGTVIPIDELIALEAADER